MMNDPLYGLVIQSKDNTTEKSSTKTISGINVPAMTSQNKSAIGTDLDTIGNRLVNLTTGRTHTKSYLNARMEVNSNG